jgi:uncharacterized protein (TIGR03435 family)
MRLSVIFLMCLAAQAQDTSAQFEVASVKVAVPSGSYTVYCHGGPGWPNPGLLLCENYNVTGFIYQAFDLKAYQLQVPDRFADVRVNVSARVPEGTTHEQFRLMLKNMLVERFKLTFHYEKKEMSSYDLVTVKGGAKIKPSPTASAPEEEVPINGAAIKKDEEGFPILPPGRKPMMMAIGGGFAIERYIDETMEQFADSMAGRLDGPVNDATGLKGKYDFTLRWIQDGAPSTDITGPTLLQSIQDQLGLRVQKTKSMVDVLVVDHLEKMPTEN